jgi:hypothetical protein
LHSACVLAGAVHLTKTSKKGRGQKEKLVSQLHDCVDLFKNAFVFTVDNMRNDKLKEVRQVWSRLVCVACQPADRLCSLRCRCGRSGKEAGLDPRPAFLASRADLCARRFFLGKNKVMVHALGRTASTEYAENLHHLTEVSVACLLVRLLDDDAGIQERSHEHC